MQKRILFVAVGLMLLFGIGLVSLTPMTVAAIGEITPTPAPALPDEDIDVNEALTQGFSSVQSGNVQAGLDAFTLALQAEPDNAEAYMLRALAYSSEENYTPAIADLSEAIDLVPQTYHPDRAVIFPLTQWFLITVRGNLYEEMGDSTAALADYDAALALTPSTDNDVTFEARAALLHDMGDTAAGDVDAAIARAFGNMNTGNLNAAMDLLTEAIDSGQRTSSVAIAYYNRAILNDVQDNVEMAIADYSAALEINPNMHIAYLARGIRYRESGDIQAAGKDFYNRMTAVATDFVDERAAIGEGLEVEMDYQRVVRISFESAAGQTVTISARETSSLETDPMIVLLDPNGNPIAGDDDFGGNLDSLLEDFELPVDGTYTLMVSHAEGGYAAGFEGTILVAFENCSTSGACA